PADRPDDAGREARPRWRVTRPRCGWALRTSVQDASTTGGLSPGRRCCCRGSGRSRRRGARRGRGLLAGETVVQVLVAVVTLCTAERVPARAGTVIGARLHQVIALCIATGPSAHAQRHGVPLAPVVAVVVARGDDAVDAGGLTGARADERLHAESLRSHRGCHRPAPAAG